LKSKNRKKTDYFLSEPIRVIRITPFAPLEPYIEAVEPLRTSIEVYLILQFTVLQGEIQEKSVK